MDRAKRWFEYPFPEGHALGNRHPDAVPGCLPIYKIHGSVNWAPVVKGAELTGDARVAWDSTRVSSASRNSKINDGDEVLVSDDEDKVRFILSGKRESLRGNLVDQYKHDAGIFEPLLATYAPTKPAANNRSTLELTREAALKKLTELDRGTQVIALGVRPPVDDGDDPPWSKICEALSERQDLAKFYVGPQPSDADRRAMQDYGFEVIELTLKDWLAQLSPTSPT